MALSSSRSVAGHGPRPPIGGAEMPFSVFEMTVMGFLIVVVLYFGQVVLVPLALAVILAFLLAPAVRLLRRGGLGNTLSVLIVVAAAFSIILGIGGLITQQVGSLVDQLPSYQATLRDKVKALRDVSEGGGVLKQTSETLKNLQEELEAPTQPGAPAPSVSLAPLRGSPYDAPSGYLVPVEVRTPEPTALDQLQRIIGISAAPVVTAGAALLFLVFLLLQREDVRDRAIRLLGAHDLEKSTTAMDDAGERLAHYLLALTGINAAFGVVIAVGLWAIGIPSPLLWGVVAMLMRFVPFIGSFIAAALPLLLAAAVDPGWGTFLMTLTLYAVTEPIMGSVIEPVVQGQRTGLSPLAVIISTAFWALLWGPIGLLLAVPLTAVLVVLGSHVERLEFLKVLLGDTPPLEPAERFYQRMLAGDPAEAVEQAEKILQETPLVDYYDDVVVDGLLLAQADADRGTLASDRFIDIRDTAVVVIDTLSENAVRTRKPAVSEPAANEEAGEKAVTETEQEEEEAAISEPMELALSDEWKGEKAVLCVASRTALDETVALALAQLLEKYGIGTKVIDVEHQRHGDLRAEDLEGAKLVCVSALDARERSAYARFLVRRMRRSAPGATILGCFWKLATDTETDAAIVESIAVDGVATTLREALRFCLDAAREDSAAAQAAAVAPMRVEAQNSSAAE